MKAISIIVVALALVACSATSPAPTPPDACDSPRGKDLCYGTGEWDIFTRVKRTKCPQLNLTMHGSTKTPIVYNQVLVRDGEFTDDSAKWYIKNITGIGIDGYYYDGESKQDKKADYGWFAGIIPNGAPLVCPPGTPPADCDIVVGMEVLCRDKVQTEGQFMEGQIVDPSLNDEWVCKLKDATKPLLPFVPMKDIRPLCFAHESDYLMAEVVENKWPVHPFPNWREEKLGVSLCNAYCTVQIVPDGTCPDTVTLADNVLHYRETENKGNDWGPENYFELGQVTGIFGDKDAKTFGDFSYEIDFLPVQPKWGPQAGGDYIVPIAPAVGITEQDGFGSYVLCPANGGPTNGDEYSMLDPVFNKTNPGSTYKGGTIFNTPLFTTPAKGKDKDLQKDARYHIYPCNPQQDMDYKKSTRCTTDDMLALCYPYEL